MLDAVIVGGGAAGTSLAAHLAACGWDDRRVVLVDDPAGADPDRTWGYWSSAPLLVDDAAELEFDRFAVHAGGRTEVVGLGPYRYRVVRRRALCRLAARLAAQAPGFERVPGRVTAVHDGRHAARVDVAGTTLEAAWVFDSTSSWRPSAGSARGAGTDQTDAAADAAGGHVMAATGWSVRTDRDTFDPDVPVLCDFRLPAGRPAFVHVLPYGPRAALVEHTAFVPPGQPAPDGAGVAAELTAYLADVLHAGRYTVERVERARIPLRPGRSRRHGRRVLAIGAAAGLVRASSGYGFAAAQRDAAGVVRSLIVHGHPFDVRSRPWRHRALDAVFLRALARDPHALEPAFAAMFGGPDPLRVLRFLDEDTTPREELRLVAGLPRAPFLRALLPGRLPPDHAPDPDPDVGAGGRADVADGPRTVHGRV